MTELSACQQLATTIARDFRIGENIRAQRELPGLIQQVILHFPKRELSHVQQLKFTVKGIRISQEKRDWLGLADYLEHELQDLLQLYL